MTKNEVWNQASKDAKALLDEILKHGEQRALYNRGYFKRDENDTYHPEYEYRKDCGEYAIILDVSEVVTSDEISYHVIRA